MDITCPAPLVGSLDLIAAPLLMASADDDLLLLTTPPPPPNLPPTLSFLEQGSVLEDQNEPPESKQTGPSSPIADVAVVTASGRLSVGEFLSAKKNVR